MKRSREPMEYQKWAAMGSELKKVRTQVMDILCNREYQQHFTVKETDALSKVIRNIEKFQSDAENQMYREISHRYKDKHAILNVFYGSHTEPFPEPEKMEGY
jgi:hypothetical protein